MEVLQAKHHNMRIPPVENLKCNASENYDEVPESLPLDLSEYDIISQVLQGLWEQGQLS